MTLKNTFRTLALAACALSGTAFAADNHDILLGIRTEATGDNDIVINLGDFLSSSNFTTPGTHLIGNFKTFLDTNLGTGWNTSSTNFWGVIGGNTSGTRVVYAANSGAPYGSMTSANVSGGSAQAGGLYVGVSSLAIGQAMTIADSDVNSWTVRKGADVFGMPNSKVDNLFFEQSTDFSLVSGMSTQLTRVTGSGVWTDLGTITFASNGDVSFTAVPEPSTYGLMGAGALAAGALMRRRRKAAAAKAA